jgi:hypothetical protein
MTNEEQEPTKWKIIFQGCNHETTMSTQELLNPSRQMYDRSTNHKEDYYLCWDCLHEEKGACSISPYHKIVAATRITQFNQQQQRRHH